VAAAQRAVCPLQGEAEPDSGRREGSEGSEEDSEELAALMKELRSNPFVHHKGVAAASDVDDSAAVRPPHREEEAERGYEQPRRGGVVRG
jgi:hypothetical protein